MASVSIILPTYNRAKFLPDAIRSICQQSYDRWELLIVDDGSTDDTRQVVADLTGSLKQPVHYIYQPNRGAYAARNSGLDKATGDYIAFFDSDDEWFPYHLERCVCALESNQSLDWVYGSHQRVEYASGRVLTANMFFESPKQKWFRSLETKEVDGLRILLDRNVVPCMICHGIGCLLQASLIRRRTVFEKFRFWQEFRNQQDHVMVLRALAAGSRFGYFTEPHLRYRMHADHSSLLSGSNKLQKAVSTNVAVFEGYRRVGEEFKLTSAERRALRQRLSDILFWRIGYACYWRHGCVREAEESFNRAMEMSPWNPWFWKTYLMCRGKLLIGLVPKSTVAAR